MTFSYSYLLEQLIESSTVREYNWLTLLGDTRWLAHISLLLKSALTIAFHVEELGLNVLIHCSDGWDRTAQLAALAQLLLDPYFRTIDGFCVLIQKV